MRHGHRGEGHVKMEAEARVIEPQAKAERVRKDPPAALVGSTAPILYFRLPELGKGKFLLF